MPREIIVKSVLNKKKQRDSWFLDDYTLNMYSSCSFNCLYCYIRGSKYGFNLAESVSVKVNGIAVLEKQLASRAKKNQHGMIVVSSATDPYLSLEKKYTLTRQALQLIERYRFPVHMLTKSPLIERDIDILHRIDQSAILPEGLQDLKRGTIVTFSLSTIDDEVAKIFEPGAPPPSQRLMAVQKMVREGFLCGISLMPLIPFVSDTAKHLDEMFSAFRDAGVHYVMPATITLFGENEADSKPLMLEAIRKNYPELVEKYKKFFNGTSEMPSYYRQAFYKKMQSLGKEYQLEYRILQAALNLQNDKCP